MGKQVGSTIRFRVRKWHRFVVLNKQLLQHELV